MICLVDIAKLRLTFFWHSLVMTKMAMYSSAPDRSFGAAGTAGGVSKMGGELAEQLNTLAHIDPGSSTGPAQPMSAWWHIITARWCLTLGFNRLPQCLACLTLEVLGEKGRAIGMIGNTPRKSFAQLLLYRGSVRWA